MPIKSDIISILNKRFPQLMIDDINLSVNVILNEIGKALQQGRKAEFREFGVFTAKKKAQRTARNPKTGALLTTPAKTVPHFKPSVFLNRRLNSKQPEISTNNKKILKHNPTLQDEAVRMSA